MKALLVGVVCAALAPGLCGNAHAQQQQQPLPRLQPAPPAAQQQHHRGAPGRSVVLAPVALPVAPAGALRLHEQGAARLRHAWPRPAPGPRPERDRWWAMDKAKHAGGSFFVTLGGQYVFETKAGLAQEPALALSLGSGAAVGLAKEVYDWRLGSARHFSARDLAADALGLLLAAGVVLL